MKTKTQEKKTDGDLRIFKDYMSLSLELRAIEDIPPEELSEIVSRFLISVRKKNHEEYEPSSLRGIISSIDRHLKKSKYGTSIMEGPQFQQTREILSAKLKHLKKSGKGNKPFAAETLTDDVIEKLFENKQLGIHNPESVINTMWLYNTIGFGLRGADKHRQMCWGDITLKAEDQQEYLELNERKTKTRQGTSTDVRPIKPKIWGTGTEKCPVELYKFYQKKRPEKYCNEADPFYIATSTKPDFDKDHDSWFRSQPIGVMKLNTIMKRMSSTLGGKGYTNHSARKYMIQTLVDKGVPPTEVVQISGHKNLASVNAYSKVTIKRHREISSLLFDKSDDIQPLRKATKSLNATATQPLSSSPPLASSYFPSSNSSLNATATTVTTNYLVGVRQSETQTIYQPEPGRVGTASSTSTQDDGTPNFDLDIGDFLETGGHEVVPSPTRNVTETSTIRSTNQTTATTTAASLFGNIYGGTFHIVINQNRD